MQRQQEYHNVVDRSILASLAVFGVFSVTVFMGSAGHAQVNSGAGGGHFSSAPPTANFTPPPTANNVPPPTGSNLHTNVPHNGASHNHNSGQSHRYHCGSVYSAYPCVGGFYAYPVPYAADAADDPGPGDDANYQGGPTIFDRRGAGPQAYIPPVNDPQPPHGYQAAAAPADPPADADQPEELTMLVFKDGHQVEVGNYAIVGHMLYDMSSGHPRKVALADLDLDATEKQNSDRGVVFQLPPSAQVN